MYFAVALSRRLSPASMQVYISAVGSLHRQHGTSDPIQQNTLLRLVLQGALRTYAINTSRVRQPITLPILVKLVYSIKRSPLPKWDKNMLTAAFTWAFYGLLRISSRHPQQPNLTLVYIQPTPTSVGTNTISYTTSDGLRQTNSNLVTRSTFTKWATALVLTLPCSVTSHRLGCIATSN